MKILKTHAGKLAQVQDSRKTRAIMAVSRRGTGAGGLLCVIAVGSLLREGFIRTPEQVVPDRVAAAASPRSRRFVVDAVAWFAAAGATATAATAAPIQFNAQLAGDLSEAQKRSIKAYLEKNKDAPPVDVVVGERPMKVYVKPTAEELRPGSPEFKAGRLGAKQFPNELLRKMQCDDAVWGCRAGQQLCTCHSLESRGSGRGPS